MLLKEDVPCSRWSVLWYFQTLFSWHLPLFPFCVYFRQCLAEWYVPRHISNLSQLYPLGGWKMDPTVVERIAFMWARIRSGSSQAVVLYHLYFKKWTQVIIFLGKSKHAFLYTFQFWTGLITQQFRVYTNSRLQVSDDGHQITNTWPEDCAFSCYVSVQNCRSFNYHRGTRDCRLYDLDQESQWASLQPAFDDPWDYYERGLYSHYDE